MKFIVFNLLETKPKKILQPSCFFKYELEHEKIPPWNNCNTVLTSVDIYTFSSFVFVPLHI